MQYTVCESNVVGSWWVMAALTVFGVFGVADFGMTMFALSRIVEEAFPSE